MTNNWLSYQRGNGPLVSVIIPTRGRSKKLMRSIYSLLENAEDHNIIEFMFKVDDDDNETIELLNKELSFIKNQVHIEISPRGMGYEELHLWVNRLSMKSQADWLYLWNDDAIMLTHNWDQILLNYPQQFQTCRYGITALLTPVSRRPLSTEFMFIRRRVTEILGNYSLSPHCDTWMYTIMNFIQCVANCPIVVDHDNECEDDETSSQRKASFFKTGSALVSTPSMLLKIGEAMKLLAYINSCVTIELLEK